MARGTPALYFGATVLGVAALGVTLLSGVGQSHSGASGDRTVVVGFYPLEYVVDRLAGADVDVVNLSAPGVEPHDLELTPRSVADVTDADLVVFLSGFQPALDDAVDSEAAAALDVRAAADLTLTNAEGGVDPHFWLDPMRLAAVASTTADALVDAGVVEADTAASNLTALTRDLRAVDRQYRSSLANCASQDLVTSHEAFGYLAAAYHLQQVGITGLSPDAEPDPQGVADVSDLVEHDGVRTIYHEVRVSPAAAETVARETGADVGVLDPLESLASGAKGDYLTVMATNLRALRDGQGCV